MGLPIPRHALQEDEDEGSGVQLAPLVDIVFLLLIFFLVATTFQDNEKDLSLALPRTEEGEAAASAPRIDRVLLNVRADGMVLLGQAPVSRENLYRALVEARRENPEVPVVLRGDRGVSHGEMVEVYALCQRARIRNLAVAVGADGRGE